MNLKDFLFAKSKAEREDFATRAGTTSGHLQNVAYGYRTCAEGLAIAIERESARAVTCEELRPDVDWAYLRGTKRKRA